MIAAAIYSRKSTEQHVSDDAKSVTRQLELARAFAEEQGWAVLEEYVDERRVRRGRDQVDRARADARGGRG
jgi:DNA invertase Pin-like site-specific DNA recombinase